MLRLGNTWWIAIKNLALASWNTAVSFGPTEGQITDSVLDDGSNLPKYYFGDLPAEVMQEIMDEMASSKPDQDIEEVDHWLNCHNVEATIPDWYDHIAAFKAER